MKKFFFCAVICRYYLQISKCEDISCYGKLRLNIWATIKEKLFPGPFLLNTSTECGVKLASVS